MDIDESMDIPREAATLLGESSPVHKTRADGADAGVTTLVTPEAGGDAEAVRRIARLAATGDWERAEREIDALLATFEEGDLPGAYIRLVEEVLAVAEPTVGPDPIVVTEPPARPVRPRGDLRRNYAYAILTALRVRLTPKDADGDRSAA